MITLWWAGLAPVMKILWVATLAATLIFIIQSILTFVGADADASADFDFDGDADMSMDGASLYSFRNFVNFILGFGWSAILLKPSVESWPLLIIISVVVGVALVAAVMYLFKWLASMQQSGNINLEKAAAGSEGTVYLTIPGARAGKGKVQISIGGAVREYDALYEGESALKNGTPIRVVDVLDSNTVLVEETNSYTV
jgi:membrane protein implicated in regulation of membrane protease activity